MFSNFWKVLKHFNRAPEIFRCAKESRQWVQVTAAYLGLSRLPYPYILHLRAGEQVRLEEPTDLKTFWQVFLRKVYRVEAADRLIVDVGANIGLFTLYAARQAPRAQIVALEPFPATFGRLSATVREHNLESRVTCLNYAAAGESGVRVMRDVAVPSQRRSLATPSTDLPGTPVCGKTLEQILDENHLLQVDLLKMDIEGSEYEVLLGAPQRTLKQIGRLALEYHGDSAPYSKQQLFEHLGLTGFSVSWDECDELGYGVVDLIRGN